MPHVLYDGNTNRLLGKGLHTRDLISGEPVYLDGSAVLAVTLVDHATQTQIAGGIWPLSLTYIEGSNGDFHAPIRADALTLTPYQAVDAVIAGTSGVDQIIEVRLECLVQTRRL